MTEGHGLRFKFARVTRGRAVVGTMQQTVCVLVGEHEEGLCGRKTVQDLNAFTCRGPERAAKIIGCLDRNSLFKDGGTEGVRPPAGIARRDRDPARIAMPFSPLRTKRPIVRQV
jgi:hypothetical protein